ncbi:MAG: hypothetical protein U9R25_04880 [Chloroflexota bacterium]|nr:hypothetical protein [Chloroflexota bacterium]
MKKLRIISLFGLVALLLMAALPVYADPIPGEGNTDVVVANTNQNAGAPAANVVARYYNNSGTLETERPRNVNPRGSYAFLAGDANLGDGWNGAMIIQSDNELAATAEITWSNGGSADGTTAGAYLGYDEGATEMYLPFVVRASFQFTRISVQNTENSSTSYNVKYINRDGNVDFTISDTLQARGSTTYDVHMPGGKVPDLSTTGYWASNGFWGGAIKITTTGGKKIAAVATNHWNHWGLAYNGASSGSVKNYIPSSERRYDAVQGWRGFSVAIVQCAESSSSCDVKLDYVNSQTQNVDLTVSKTINAGAALGSNTKGGGDFDPNLYATHLGDTWAGSVIVSTTNNKKVSVISYSIRPGTLIAGATSAANAGDAGAETFLPAVYQKNTDGVSCPDDPNNDWQQFSLIRIQNPTNTNATDVDISYFNRNGTLALQELNNTINAEKSYNRNTRNHCAQIDLGGTWEGSVYISSNVDLVAVSETLWGGTKMNSYNGFSK